MDVVPDMTLQHEKWKKHVDEELLQGLEVEGCCLHNSWKLTTCPMCEIHFSECEARRLERISQLKK